MEVGQGKGQEDPLPLAAREISTWVRGKYPVLRRGPRGLQEGEHPRLYHESRERIP